MISSTFHWHAFPLLAHRLNMPSLFPVCCQHVVPASLVMVMIRTQCPLNTYKAQGHSVADAADKAPCNFFEMLVTAIKNLRLSS